MLSIAIPKEYHLDSKTWKIISKDGVGININATVTSVDGSSYKLDKMGFRYDKGKQYLDLLSSQRLDPNTEYIQVTISSSASLITNDIQWNSTDKI